MKLKRIVFVFILCLGGISAETPKKSWIHFKPHLYAGFGSVTAISQNALSYEIVDEGPSVPGSHKLKSKGLHFHGTGRVSLLDIGNASFGYTFWGYRYRYEDDYPDLWYALDVMYPFQYDLSLHAGFMQVNLPFLNAWDNHLEPHILVGAGSYFGSSKRVFYTADYELGGLWEISYRDNTYKGWAWMAGAGIVIYRYGYIYAGITRFSQPELPGRTYLDITVGVRI